MKFEVLDREQLYRGRAFAVERVGARLPNGNVRQFDLVNHVDSVTIVPVDECDRILFVRQYRLGALDVLLELPAGVLDENEESDHAAARELREETGVAAGTFERLGDYYLAPGYSSERMVAYLARDLRDDPLDADADEFIEIEAIPVEQAYRMAAAGEIRDGKSLAALLLARSRLLKE